MWSFAFFITLLLCVHRPSSAIILFSPFIGLVLLTVIYTIIDSIKLKRKTGYWTESAKNRAEVKRGRELKKARKRAKRERYGNNV